MPRAKSNLTALRGRKLGESDEYQKLREASAKNHSQRGEKLKGGVGREGKKKED